MPGLLLLLLFIVDCGCCRFELKGVENIKATIESNPTGFRSVFPKDYRVVHHYTRSMLCETEPCCVFSAAVVLVESWHVLLTNLWDQHLNYTFILELKETLDKIVNRNKNIERFQEETDLDQYPTLSSSPEELLNLTLGLFARWLEVGCSPSIETCLPPTLPPSVERKDYGPVRVKLLTTRAINSEENQPGKRIASKPPSSCGRSLSLPRSAAFWSPLLLFLSFGLY
ncbi:uncharacterized protein zgc:174888 [Cyprinodon tularosa]|uniref:Uncharacterized LOC107088811 n=1 Tax=Cyprinodon variegatus TaxID=28743 RepID=A0A3Q2CLX7_CYPVA|nr:PREDICTED: uncharacterized protein LOC107088811 [Cyprinodon variegatus]XP_038140154.1 uncharacterized protein zgc:174888 [Cyprinodon tularosa]